MNKLTSLIYFNIFLFLALAHAVVAQSDPGTLSTGDYQKLEYDLGDIFQPSQFQSSFVEVKASVHAPTAPGTYPLVIMLHGRHVTCYTSSGSLGFVQYPCGAANEIPNYAGYDYIGELLASRGYIMVSISSNGIIGVSNGSSDNQIDGNALARAELIDHHLDLWNTWSSVGGGPFGNDFVGKVDMNNIITVGHSRGGEGAVRHYLYNQTQNPSYNINGVFAIAPTAFDRISDGTMNLGFMTGDCDGDVATLQGLFYYDDSRYQSLNSDGGTYHNFILKGANHSFFNTVWTPGEYSGGGTKDDWVIVDENQGDPYCGIFSNTNERLSAAQQRNVLKAYISAFVEKYAGDKDIYDDILSGFADAPPSTTINSDVLHTSYHPPVSERKDINRMTENSNAQTNTVGGNVTTSGLSSFESCGYDENGCGQNWDIDDHYIFHFVGLSRSSLGRIWLEWTSPGAWYRNAIPAGQGNVSAYTHITLRAAVNSNGNINLNEDTPQNFTLELTDGSGNTDLVEVADYSDALYVGRGTISGHLPRSLSHTIAIPLTAFSSIDLNNISNLRFIFNKSDKGSLLISDIAFARIACIQQGLACDDGDPCTSGEIYDTNCNCTGGTQNQNDADNDGVCDLNDSCPGINDAFIGTACDDNNPCTTDIYDTNCNCISTLIDIDNDGICDTNDICLNGNDNTDINNDGVPDACEACPTYDFNFNTVISYDNNGQDFGPDIIQDGGATVYMDGNAWKAIEINYTVTPNTVIQFDFKSTVEGEIHEVSFDNNLFFDLDHRMVIYGDQGYDGTLNNPTYNGTGNWQTFTVNIGAQFTGTFQYLVLTADDDANAAGNSYFRSMKLFEDTDGDNLCDFSCGGSTATDSVSEIFDEDLFIDGVGFANNPNITFTDPATPANAVLSDISLELYFRLNGNSCENEIAIQITDPAGNTQPLTAYTSCNGGTGLYYVNLDVPSGNTIGSIADWLVEFDDTNDQNAGYEYSVRFARLNYEATTGGSSGETLVNEVSEIADMDLFIDGVGFANNPSATFSDPGTPANAVLSDISLELYFRLNGASCENEIAIQITDPAGNTQPLTAYTSCNGGTGLYYVNLDVPSGNTTGSVADWLVEFDDTNDQNSDYEYSVRFGRLTYTTTHTEGGSGTPVIVNGSVSDFADSDLFIDGVGFENNGTYTFTDPGTLANAVLSDISLELYFRLNGNSCENEIALQITDPAGNTQALTAFATCNGGTGLYYVDLDVPNGNTTGSTADWVLQFDDTNDQNADYEYSVRFGRLTYSTQYDICDTQMMIAEKNNQQLNTASTQRLDNSSTHQFDNSLKLYPVPANQHLNVAYFSENANSTNIEILSGEGKMLVQQEEFLQEGINTIQLNIAKLPAGHYHIRIYNADDIQMQSFVKIRP